MDAHSIKGADTSTPKINESTPMLKVPLKWIQLGSKADGLGAPSQKTSILGRVVQILIYLKLSPPLTDVGLFVRPKSQQKLYKPQ